MTIYQPTGEWKKNQGVTYIDDGQPLDPKTRPSQRYVTTDRQLVPTSTKRYVRGDDQHPTRRFTTAGDVEDDIYDQDFTADTQEIEFVQPVHSGRRGMSVGRDVTYRPQPKKRQETYDDREIDTSKATSRRSFLKKWIGYGTGAAAIFVVGSFTLGSWLLGEKIQFDEQQTLQPSVSLTLVCGHHDSPTSPTELHAYLQNDSIYFVEIPGGDPKKSTLFQTDSLSRYYSGDVSRVFLTLEKVQVADNKYQILLHATFPGIGIYQSAKPVTWIFVDSGKGYFIGVNPKNGG